MYEAKQRAEWERTAQVLHVLAAGSLKRNDGRSWRFEDFMPTFGVEASQEKPGVRALRDFFK